MPKFIRASVVKCAERIASGGVQRFTTREAAAIIMEFPMFWNGERYDVQVKNCGAGVKELKRKPA